MIRGPGVGLYRIYLADCTYNNYKEWPKSIKNALSPLEITTNKKKLKSEWNKIEHLQKLQMNPLKTSKKECKKC